MAPRKSAIGLVSSLLLLVLAAAPAWGQGSLSEPVSFPEQARTDAAELQPKAKSRISKQTGAFTYSLPLTVPKGRRGIQPSLSLEYSSDARQRASWAGAGWSLELPTIQRVVRFGTPPTKRVQSNVIALLLGQYVYDDDPKEDRPIFSHRGEDLVETASSASYREYRYRVLTSLHRFRYFHNARPTYWEVTRPDGTLEYYGRLPEGTTGGVVQNDLGTFEWGLVRVVDVFGNHLDVSYAPVHAPEPERNPVPPDDEFAYLGDDTLSCYARFRQCMIETKALDPECIPPQAQCQSSDTPPTPDLYCGVDRATIEIRNIENRCAQQGGVIPNKATLGTTDPLSIENECDSSYFTIARRLGNVLQDELVQAALRCSTFYRSCLAGGGLSAGNCDEPCPVPGGVKYGLCTTGGDPTVPIGTAKLAELDPDQVGSALVMTEMVNRYGPAALHHLGYLHEPGELDVSALRTEIPDLPVTLRQILGPATPPRPELTPVRIDYGGNLAASFPHPFSVRFVEGGTRNDRGIDYLRGAVTRAPLLSAVEVWQGERRIRSYVLEHQDSPDTRRPLLTRVAEVSGDGELGAPGVRFTYQSAYTGTKPDYVLRQDFQFQPAPAASHFQTNALDRLGQLGQQVFFGTPSQIQSIVSCLQGGLSGARRTIADCALDSVEAGAWGFQLRDLDGDGIPELFHCNLRGGSLVHCAPQWAEGVSQATVTGSAATGYTLSYQPPVYPPHPTVSSISNVMDLDQDGVPDGFSIWGRSGSLEGISPELSVYWGSRDALGWAAVPASHSLLPYFPRCQNEPWTGAVRPLFSDTTQQVWLFTAAIQTPDLDGDGFPDIVLTKIAAQGKTAKIPRVWRYDPAPGRVGTAAAARGSFLFVPDFRVTGGDVFAPGPGAVSNFTTTLKQIISTGRAEAPELPLGAAGEHAGLDCETGMPVAAPRNSDLVQLIDINGDGLADLLFGPSWWRPNSGGNALPSPTGVHVHLNRGYELLKGTDTQLGLLRYSESLGMLCHDNWGCRDSYSPDAFPLAAVRWADINGDGLVDLLFSLQTAQGLLRAVYLNTGSKMVHSPEWSSRIPEGVVFAVEKPTFGSGEPWESEAEPGLWKDKVRSLWQRSTGVRPRGEDWFASTGTTVTDVNGDGLPDFVTINPAGSPGTSAQVYLHPGVHPDLLIGVQSDAGYQAGVTYTSSSRFPSSPFAHADPEIVRGVAPMTPKQVVSEMWESSGVGPAQYTKLHYRDGRRDVRERRDLGFATVTASTCEGEGTVGCATSYRRRTTWTYHQIASPDRVAMRGAPAQVVEEGGGAESITRTMTYAIRTPAQQGSQSTRFQKTVRAERTQETVQTCDPGGSCLARTTTTAYDDDGFPVSETTTADGVDVLRTESTYARNEPMNLYGLLATRRQVDLTAPGGAVASDERYCYADGEACPATPSVAVLKAERRARVGAAPVCGAGSTDESVVRYEHDAFGSVSAVVREPYPGSGLASRTELDYDAETHTLPVQQRVPVGATTLVTSAAYDVGFGVVTSFTDPAGVNSTWEYDGLGRLVVARTRDGEGELRQRFRFVYEWEEVPFRNRIFETKIANEIQTVEYVDGRGQLLQRYVKGEGMPSFFLRASRSYDRHGNVVSEALPVGTYPTEDFRPGIGTLEARAYDARDRRIEETTADGRTRYWRHRAATTLETDYNGNHRLVGRDALGRVRTISYEYLPVSRQPPGQPDDLSWLPSAATWTFDWDGLSRLGAAVDPSAVARWYTYDERGDLATVTLPAGVYQRCGDGLGRVLLTRTPAARTIASSFDAAGRKIHEARSDGNELFFTYDTAGLGRLGSIARGTERLDFQYDGAGRLWRRDWQPPAVVRQRFGFALLQSDRYWTLGGLLGFVQYKMFPPARGVIRGWRSCTPTMGSPAIPGPSFRSTLRLRARFSSP